MLTDLDETPDIGRCNYPGSGSGQIFYLLSAQLFRYLRLQNVVNSSAATTEGCIHGLP